MPEKRHFETEEEKGSFVPSSPVKRTLAWIGLVYMAILLGLSTVFYFTGKALMGIAPLLAVPGLIGLGVVALVSWKTTGSPGKKTAICLAVLCCVVALLLLPDGIARLMANFRG